MQSNSLDVLINIELMDQHFKNTFFFFLILFHYMIGSE